MAPESNEFSMAATRPMDGATLAELQRLYAVAAPLTNDLCMTGRNVSACSSAVALFRRGLRLLEGFDERYSSTHEALELFTRGRNIASRAHAVYLSERTVQSACHRATDAHNRGRLLR